MNTVIVSIVSPEYEHVWEVCRASLEKYVTSIPYIKVSTEEQWIKDLKKDYPYEDMGQFICAIRPTVVLKYLEQYDRVLFLGSDVVFFHPPNDLFAMDHNVVVFPHITSPISFDNTFPNMSSIHKTGNINSDIVLWSNDYTVIKFLEWQADTHKQWCINKDGIFLDQTWLNQLPFFVDDVFIYRHPGYNYAYFNMKERYLGQNFYTYPEDKSIEWHVSSHEETKPLVCAQFSGFVEGQPEQLSKHTTYKTSDGHVRQLFNWYDDELAKAKMKLFKDKVRMVIDG